jgi:hypothetical protein
MAAVGKNPLIELVHGRIVVRNRDAERSDLAPAVERRIDTESCGASSAPFRRP